MDWGAILTLGEMCAAMYFLEIGYQRTAEGITTFLGGTLFTFLLIAPVYYWYPWAGVGIASAFLLFSSLHGIPKSGWYQLRRFNRRHALFQTLQGEFDPHRSQLEDDLRGAQKEVDALETKLDEAWKIIRETRMQLEKWEPPSHFWSKTVTRDGVRIHMDGWFSNPAAHPSARIEVLLEEVGRLQNELATRQENGRSNGNV